MNVALLKQVMNTILEKPEEFDQTKWHHTDGCNTRHCFAGWAQILSGHRQCSYKAQGDAISALGISLLDGDWLFSRDRNINELYDYVSHHVAGTPRQIKPYVLANRYSREGFDLEGFDRNDYDREGYHRNGYNRNGRKRNGTPLPTFP